MPTIYQNSIYIYTYHCIKIYVTAAAATVSHQKVAAGSVMKKTELKKKITYHLNLKFKNKIVKTSS